MDFNTYQEKAWSLLKPGLSHNQKISYFSMKMAEEVGEIIGPLAKNMIHNKDIPENHVINELGDLMFYVAVMAKEFNISLEDVINFNIDKLTKRHGDSYKASYYK